MGGPSRRSDLRPPPLHHRIRIRIRPPRLCANASPRCPLPNLATPSSLLPRPLYTHTGSGEQQHDLFVVPILAGRVQGGGGGGDPRETAGEVGERINRVSGGLAPEFQTFPVNRRRGRGRGGRGGQGGRGQGWNEGQCLHKTAREAGEATGCRFAENEPPRRLLCGLRSPWLRALPHEPRLKFNSNSPRFLHLLVRFPSLVRSFVRSYVRSQLARPALFNFRRPSSSSSSSLFPRWIVLPCLPRGQRSSPINSGMIAPRISMSVSIRDFCNLDEKFSRSSRIVVMVILFEVKIVPRVFHSVSLSLLPLRPRFASTKSSYDA